MLFEVELDVVLRPIWHRDPPRVRLCCHDDHRELKLHKITASSFRFHAAGSQTLSIQLLNKTDLDTVPDLGLDKAVIIESISFFGINDPRFVWAGRYQPIYPEPWASQQRSIGHDLAPVLTNVDRLGWNGVWSLAFDLPIFTWIHHVQNLGWIYR